MYPYKKFNNLFLTEVEIWIGRDVCGSVLQQRQQKTGDWSVWAGLQEVSIGQLSQGKTLALSS